MTDSQLRKDYVSTILLDSKIAVEGSYYFARL